MQYFLFVVYTSVHVYGDERLLLTSQLQMSSIGESLPVSPVTTEASSALASSTSTTLSTPSSTPRSYLSVLVIGGDSRIDWSNVFDNERTWLSIDHASWSDIDITVHSDSGAVITLAASSTASNDSFRSKRRTCQPDLLLIRSCPQVINYTITYCTLSSN
jgi:hypothetical protein